jgi:leucyl aminopeptidase
MSSASTIEFVYPFPFVTSTKKDTVPVIVLTVTAFKGLKNKNDKALLEANGFIGNAGQVVPVFSPQGTLKKVYAGIATPMGLYDISSVADKLKAIVKTKLVFELSGVKKSDQETACIAWALACHAKDRYKSTKSKDILPTLLLPQDAHKGRIEAHVKSICLVRDLINTPANDLGPEELATTAQTLAKKHKAKIKITENQKTLEKEFPLVFTVGKASDRHPRMIDMTWGKSKDPRVTLVGKGVIYDTGGLNLKPGAYMKNMKKDMGGAAHVLGLANLVMSMNLPIRLRVIIPAVENSISGPAFRPGDILNSRKGLTIENTNTDAEGRLILADALALATEEDTNLIIDCATLTGSARAAMGPDVPAFFSTSNKVANDIRDISFKVDDPLWPMPLLDRYNKFIESPIADLTNSVGVPGDLIYSALFLKKFLNSDPDWVHIDMNAWNDRPISGRPAGGSDNAIRSLYAYLEKRFVK